MRVPLKFRPLCLAGVAIVALLAAGEALAKAGGHSAGGHWVGGRGHGQHWDGGIHGGRVGFAGERRAADFGGYWGRGFGRGGSYWGGYYGGGGVYMTMSAVTATTLLMARRPMAAGRRFMRPTITRLRRRRPIRRWPTLAMRRTCPMAPIRTSSIFPPRGIAGRARFAIAAWSEAALPSQKSHAAAASSHNPARATR